MSRNAVRVLTGFLAVATVLSACSYTQINSEANRDSGLLENTVTREIDYQTPLAEVRRPEDTRQRYGNYDIVRRDTSVGTKYVYQDSLLTAAFVRQTKNIFVLIGNSMQHTLRIHLGKGAFVGLDGESTRLLTGEMSENQRNESPSPIIIPAGASSSTTLVPANKLRSGGVAGTARVLISPDYAFRDTSVTTQADDSYRESVAEARSVVGKSYSILLPVEVQGTVNEYTFEFEVESATIETGSGKREL